MFTLSPASLTVALPLRLAELTIGEPSLCVATPRGLVALATLSRDSSLPHLITYPSTGSYRDSFALRFTPGPFILCTWSLRNMLTRFLTDHEPEITNLLMNPANTANPATLSQLTDRLRLRTSKADGNHYRRKSVRIARQPSEPLRPRHRPWWYRRPPRTYSDWTDAEVDEHTIAHAVQTSEVRLMMAEDHFQTLARLKRAVKSLA